MSFGQFQSPPSQLGGLTPEQISQALMYLSGDPAAATVLQQQAFTQFLPQVAVVTTSETTTSTTYANLATTGPQLLSVAAGQYLILFGSQATAPSANSGFMSVSINAATPSDTTAAMISFSTTSFVSALTTTLTDLSTVVAKYRVTGNTGTFANRWLAVFKYANP